MKQFSRYACWGSTDVDRFVRVTALEGDETTFRAIHIPIGDFECVKGDLAPRTDEALLSAIYERRHHSISIVEGEPGSGKSHLIQWLQLLWPKSDSDHVVLVTRGDGGLLGTLDRLRRELSERYAEPLVNLGQGSQQNLEGRAQAFLGALVTCCQRRNFEVGARVPELADWLEEYEVWRLLNHNTLRDRWSAPREIIATVESGAGRDQQAVRFTPAHVVDLVELILGASASRAAGSLKAQRLFIDLQREVQNTVRRVVRDNPDDVSGQISALGAQAPMSSTLLRALDARCEFAIQGLLGIRRDELQRRFLEVRRLLRKDGKRLVLLLEDITNLQGVDRQLIEALLPTPQTPADSDLCELVAVVGLTPNYFSQFLEGMGNLRDRLTFHVRLTTTEQSSVLERRSRFLDTSEARQRFVATYLNAARLGYSAFAAWRARGEESSRPNACPECDYRKECHASFDAVEVPGISGRVGLFPLSPGSVEKFWDHLTDPEAKRSQRTPRGVLTNVVSVVLHQNHEITSGRFPSDKLESRNLDAPNPGPALRQLLDSIPEPEKSRTRRTIVWWGDENSGAISAGVLSAFGVGGVFGTAPAPVQETGQGPSVPAPPPPKKHTTSGSKVPPAAASRDECFENLNAWMADKTAGLSFWEDLLFALVRAIEPDALGRPRWLWAKIFTKENISLEGGRSDGKNVLRFVLPRETAVHVGLDAVERFRREEGGSSDYSLFAKVAKFQCDLTTRVTRHFDEIQSKLEESSGGCDPGQLAARSLVAIAWMNAPPRASGGVAFSKASLPLQWRSALGSETREGLTPRWNTLARFQLRERLQEIVYATLRVGQTPNVPRHGLVDPALVKAAVDRFRNAPSEWPEISGSALPKSIQSEIAAAHAIVSELRREFAKSIEEEWQEVVQLGARTSKETDDGDTESLLTQAEGVVERLAGIDAELVPIQLQSEWTTSLKSLKKVGLWGKGIRRVDDALAGLRGASPKDLKEKLERILDVPRPELSSIDAAVGAAARVLRKASTISSSWTTAKATKDNEVVDSAVQTLRSVSEALLLEARRKGTKSV